MPIPSGHQGRYVYHMTHMENLENIIKHGLLSTNQKNALGIKHRNIAYQSIQERRSEMDVTCGPGGKVHDYVPFYFCARDPMLLGQLNKKNIDQHLIIYLAVKIDILDNQNCVFTSSAANSNQAPCFLDDSKDLYKLDWDVIDKKDWKYEGQVRRNKMAEALFFQKVNFSDIGFLVVFNEWSEKQVKSILEKTGKNIPLKFGDYPLVIGGVRKNINHYYTRFMVPGETNLTLVIGPDFLFDNYKLLIKIILESKNRKSKYSSLTEFITALYKTPTCLKELADLEGLETTNEIHWQNALDHTLSVVRILRDNLKNLNYSQEEKSLIILAGYLHDIGKAKSPRKEGKSESDKNHAYRGIPLLERIFTEEITCLNKQDLQLVLKLVIYDDLIGEVVGQGRHREQILQVVNSIKEFDMLVAIAKADVASLIDPSIEEFIQRCSQSGGYKWLQDINAGVPELREYVQGKLAEGEDD